MKDEIFGELEEGFACLSKNIVLEFGSIPYNIELQILVDEDFDIIKKYQYDAYKMFMDNWYLIQKDLMDELIQYYNSERFSWGPDDQEELLKWWPEITSQEDLLKFMTPESLIISANFGIKYQRLVFLLFSRAWGGEDLDDNGVGVSFLNETIDEIGYKDIVY